MAPSNETDYPNDAVLSDPPMEETTATTNRQCLNSSTGTLTLTLTPPSSSSITPGDSLPLPTLPFEIVVEILSRLPVKFLMQLRCVCKSWKSLISDAKFAKKHIRVSTTRHHLAFLTFSNPSPEFVITAYPLSSIFTELNPTATATKLEYPRSYRHRFDDIVGSCHGILCIALYHSYLILWNPSIRKFSKLPSLEIPGSYSYPIYSGFGYDHSTDTYKVVAFSHTKCGDGVYQIRTHVHTMGTNFWRRVQDFPSSYSKSGKFVSGTLNWLASKDIHLAPSLITVSLDLETESYRELLLPDYGEVDVLTKSLCVLRDCLCILSSHTGDYSEVWLMKEYGNKDSWAKLFHVPNMEFGRRYIRALYVYEDDQVLLKCRTKMVVYNSRDGTLQIQNTADFIVPQVYQESLISPCSCS